MTFSVIDTATGEYPDSWEIALKEDWASELCYCDMEGFAIEEDGTLLLLDECGKHAYCPEGRFEVIPYMVTNEDRIKAMETEELADFLSKLDGHPCGKEFWAEWLKKELEEGEI